MKKTLISAVFLLILFSGCDGFNNNIDDLTRTLRISVTEMTDVDGGWSGTERDYQLVSAADGVATDATYGTVTVSSPADSYIRSDSVTVTPAGGTSYTFAYWLFKSRTDSAIDSNSTEGNIRYDDSDDGESVSLRTDSSTSEIIGVFAKDGIGDFAAVSLTNVLQSDINLIESTFKITPNADKTLNDPRFRIFDADGEALTDWIDCFTDNDSVTISSTGITISEDVSFVDGQEDFSNWNVVLIYKDPTDSDAVYIVK